MQHADFYGGQDPREMPAYGIPEAAHYLHIPRSTLRDWVKGRTYPIGETAHPPKFRDMLTGHAGQKFSPPLIVLPPPASGGPSALSFFNVVEAHVLGALRRQHRVSMPKVREALTCLEKHFPSKHPLADQHFATDGVDLFLDTYGHLINVTQDGQIAMRDLLRVHLSRIERDAAGVPVTLYLFTRTQGADAPEVLAAEPKVIVIDPSIAFGRPVLAGTGIPTAIIAERYKAGESIEELAQDYDLLPQAVQEAIRCELETTAA
jgi:uncharacterized protein (DUF433 family)